MKLVTLIFLMAFFSACGGGSSGSDSGSSGADDAVDDDAADDASDDDAADDDLADDDAVDDDVADDDLDDDAADDDLVDDDLDDDAADDDLVDDDLDDDAADDDTVDDDAADDDSVSTTTSTTTTTTVPTTTSTTTTTTICIPTPELPDDGIDQDCDGSDLEHNNTTGVFVATIGNDLSPGTMTEPVQTIAVGISLAEAEGKTVFVAEGSYNESVDIMVSIFGGYESAGWTRNSSVFVTTITASSSTAVIVNEGAFVAIQGFTINGGSDTNSYGIYNCSSTITLANNVIDGGAGTVNLSNSYGVYNDSGTVALANNVIDGGSGGTGNFSSRYGVYNDSGTVTLANNDIDGGTGPGSSLGFNNYFGVATLVNNYIFGGSGRGSGGVQNYVGATTLLVNNIIDGGSGNEGSFGVENHLGLVTLVHNVISGGSGATATTCGMYNGGRATLANNVINGGSGINSYGVHNYTNSLTLVNNDIWGMAQDCMVSDNNGNCLNQISFVNACGWTGCVEASGNISADPVFIDSLNDDFHLQAGSPCIDTGINPIPTYLDPSFAYLVDYDFEGDARPYGAGWEIGVDEWMP